MLAVVDILSDIFVYISIQFCVTRIIRYMLFLKLYYICRSVFIYSNYFLISLIVRQSRSNSSSKKSYSLQAKLDIYFTVSNLRHLGISLLILILRHRAQLHNSSLTSLKLIKVDWNQEKESEHLKYVFHSC